MDRLKLEIVYLSALDALMSADEYQIQAAIFRLRRAQARLHGWEVQRSPTIHSPTRRASLPVHFSPHSRRPPKAASRPFRTGLQAERANIHDPDELAPYGIRSDARLRSSPSCLRAAQMKSSR